MGSLYSWAPLVAQMVKNLPAKAGGAGDVGLILGSGRSPGGGHGNPLQCSCLENPMDREAWLFGLQLPQLRDYEEKY